MRGPTYHAPMDERERMHNAFRLAAFSFKVDAVTAEATAALSEASIPSILLKGPGITTWLYAGEEARIYGDSDLLIRKADWDRAAGVLEELGFEDDLGPLDHPRMESGAGFPWARESDGSGVDMHCTLFGIGATPDDLWAAFSADAVAEQVGGAEVMLPSHPARLLHIALHALQHGGETWDKPMKDLSRGIEKAEVTEWRQALALSERLDAAENFSTGLRLLPQGEQLAAEIGAQRVETTKAALRLAQVPMAEGFEELADAPGLRAKAMIVFRELFPNAEFMRWWSPLARRGRLGLAFAYLGRPFWLAFHAPAGLLAWWRARH